MTCDEKDRHVLAAAIRGAANQIITANVKDFPKASVAPYDIEVVTPDDFFLNALHLYPSETIAILREQAKALRRPVMTVETLLSGLARCGAAQFAKEAGDMIAVAASTTSA